jgi:ribosomal protein S12 methylthiotransferase accessory factor
VLLPAAGRLPVVLCLGQGDGRSWPAGVVSCAADPDPRRAARAAVLEQSAVGVELLRQAGAPDAGTPLAHGLRYARPEAAGELGWLAGDGPPLALGDVEAAPPGLAACIAALEAEGVRVALADATSPDLRQTGLRVARALAPGLVPLWFGDEPLGLGLARVREALGAREPNPAPHPLA